MSLLPFHPAWMAMPARPRHQAEHAGRSRFARSDMLLQFLQRRTLSESVHSYTCLTLPACGHCLCCHTGTSDFFCRHHIAVTKSTPCAVPVNVNTEPAAQIFGTEHRMLQILMIIHQHR